MRETLDTQDVVDRFDRALRSAWEKGWQPADLMRLVKVNGDRLQVDILRAAMARQAAEYEQWGRAVAPEWMAQLEEIDAGPSPRPFALWPERLGLRGPESSAAVMGFLSMLALLPPIPTLMPPPSEWPNRPRVHPGRGRLDPGMLAKVRALLAKAESTEFEAESEAFTAKAQELMTRHRIDGARLETLSRLSPTDVIGRRLGVDRPYAAAKFLLLDGVVRTNSCRAVWTEGLGSATVFGHPEDVEAVEELYTSLLVQATAALRREGPGRRVAASRTRRFRRSFLIGFARRIAQRLQETSHDTVRAVQEETGRDLVPVLTAREQAAQEALDATHGNVKSMSMSVSDREGYRAGTRVADRADLGGPPERLASHSG